MIVAFLVALIPISAIYLLGCLGETTMEKSGHLNLGLPGIMCVGAAGACCGISLYVQSIPDVNQASWLVLIVLSLLFAMVFAALAGLIYAVLTVTLRCNQNIVGLALTTFGTGLSEFYIFGIDRSVRAKLFPAAARIMAQGLPFADALGDFGKIFLSHNVVVYLAIALAVVMSLVFNRTRVGLHLRAVGENPGTADATGINVTKYKYMAILVGSAIAGIGGMLYMIIPSSMGTFQNSITLEGMGWISLALVIFTLWRPLISIIGSFVFGALYIFGTYFGTELLPKEFWNMLPYVVTIIVLIVTSILDSKKAQPPASLGTNYFREER